MLPKPQLWIGLVELKILDRKAYGAAGAFTNIVTRASDLDGFKRKANVIAAELNMYVFEVEGAEPLAERTEKWTMTAEVEDMQSRAEPNPNAIVFGTFYRYPNDEAGPHHGVLSVVRPPGLSTELELLVYSVSDSRSPAKEHWFMPALDWSQCPAVESVPGKVSGAWVFRGTRMPVATVFENLEAGASLAEIVEWFDVTREEVAAVLEFAARSLQQPSPAEILTPADAHLV